MTQTNLQLSACQQWLQVLSSIAGSLKADLVITDDSADTSDKSEGKWIKIMQPKWLYRYQIGTVTQCSKILWKNQNFRWGRMQTMSIVVLTGNGCKLFYLYGVRQTDTVMVQYLLSKGQTEF